jgi:hypothetical protein
MSIDLQFFTNMFFSFLEFIGFSLLSLSIYRIPILMYWKRLLAMQFVLLAVVFVHDYVLLNKDYYALSIAATAIILSTVLLRIPFLYSSLIWGTGYLMVVLLQTLVIFGLTASGVITVEQLASSPLVRNLALFGLFLVYCLLVYFIEKKRLGFMFIMNRFKLQKRNIQIKDLFIATLFVCTVSLVQFGIVSFQNNGQSSYLGVILGSMIVISLLGLYITYKFNMKEIDERFSSLRGRKQ